MSLMIDVRERAIFPVMNDSPLLMSSISMVHITAAMVGVSAYASATLSDRDLSVA